MIWLFFITDLICLLSVCFIYTWESLKWLFLSQPHLQDREVVYGQDWGSDTFPSFLQGASSLAVYHRRESLATHSLIQYAVPLKRESASVPPIYHSCLHLHANPSILSSTPSPRGQNIINTESLPSDQNGATLPEKYIYEGLPEYSWKCWTKYYEFVMWYSCWYNEKQMPGSK